MPQPGRRATPRHSQRGAPAVRLFFGQLRIRPLRSSFSSCPFIMLLLFFWSGSSSSALSGYFRTGVDSQRPPPREELFSAVRAQRLAREPPSGRPTDATYARAKVGGRFWKQVLSKAGELFFRVPENPDCHLGFDPRRHSGRPPLFSTPHAFVFDLGGLWLSTPVRKKPPRSPGIQGNHEALHVFSFLELSHEARVRAPRPTALRAAARAARGWPATTAAAPKPAARAATARQRRQ